MKRRQKTSLLLATISACALLAGTGCQSSIGDAGATPTPHNPDCDESYVVYGGIATDETCAITLSAIAAGMAQTNGQFIPTLTTTQGEIVGNASGLFVQWDSPEGNSSNCPAEFREEDPHHLPPISGNVHFLTISGVAGRAADDPFISFTTCQDILFSGSQLGMLLVTTGNAMTMQLCDTVMVENQITAGPFCEKTTPTVVIQQ